MFWTALAWLASWYWLLPAGRAPAARAASLAFLAGGWYLNTVTPYAASTSAAPWYYPNVALLGIYVVAQGVQQASELLVVLKDRLPGRATPGRLRWMFGGAVMAVVAIAGLMLALTAVEMRVQQKEIETGQRRQIGLWLRDHAHGPHDTVFLEPLGYIGYFSQLKMLDWPGLSSAEVIAARRQLPPITYPHWGRLIEKLDPDWLVLRPWEVEAVAADDPALLRDRYHLAKVFDVSQRVAAYRHLPGRPSIAWDSLFSVYARVAR